MDGVGKFMGGAEALYIELGNKITFRGFLIR